MFTKRKIIITLIVGREILLLSLVTVDVRLFASVEVISNLVGNNKKEDIKHFSYKCVLFHASQLLPNIALHVIKKSGFRKVVLEPDS